MIKLNDETYIAADQVKSVEVKEYDSGVLIRMKDGGHYHVSKDYGKTSYATMDRIVAVIESDLALEKRP